jgi:hypothetical protein
MMAATTTLRAPPAPELLEYSHLSSATAASERFATRTVLEVTLTAGASSKSRAKKIMEGEMKRMNLE